MTDQPEHHQWLEPGTIVDGKFRIDALIGWGSMGAVYRASQLSLERPVALKVVRSGVDANPIVLKRFQREALAIGRLRHPNIVTVHDFGHAPGIDAYLVMELVDGPTLADEIGRRERFEPREAVEIAIQVCSALQAAHDVGVIHRDVKPGNIIIETRQGVSRAKVLDFGVAKLQGPVDADRSSITGHGARLGTPVYMSPEQAASRPIDRRSDIYSLGCVLYEMLTGEPPFAGRTVAIVLLKHRAEPPKAPSARRWGLSFALDAAVLRALAKEPDERYPTADAFARALEKVPD